MRKLGLLASAIALAGMSVYGKGEITDPFQDENQELKVFERKKTVRYSDLFDKSGRNGIFNNQRQYRKMVAQNPHLRKSKKHRSKN